jgi:hypothetical protein
MPSSSLPRLELGELPPALAAALEPRVKRLGYLGEFFQCCAHQPRALAAFIELTETGQDGLSQRLAEVIALTCATWMGNDYERNQHERLSVRLGFEREWVAAANALRPEADSALTAEERGVQRLTLAILESRGKAAGTLFEEAVQSLGPQAAVAVLMVVGRCVAHGLIVNTLGLAPPVPSIFQDEFSGTSAR